MDIIETWEATVDRLTTRLMIDGFGAEIMTDLRSIAADAQRDGFAGCADAASKLIAALDQSQEGQAESLLKSGLTELRSAMQREQPTKGAPSPPLYASLADDAELVADFLVEAREHLSQIEGQMLNLERDPGAMEVIHAVFRAFHTIKGLAGFLGFSIVQAVSHEVETLLDLARNEKLVVDSAIVDAVLESGDFLLAEVAAIDRVLAGAPAVAAADNSALIAKIKRLASQRQGPVAEPSSPHSLAASEPQESAVQASAVVAAGVADANELGDKSQSSFPMEEPASANSLGSKTNAVEEPRREQAANPAAESAAKPIAGPTSAATQKPVEKAVQATTHAPAVGNSSAPETPAPAPAPSAKVATTAPSPARPADAGKAAEPAKAPDASSVRVETAKLDHLMDMVGEMVIAQSLIRHSSVLLTSNDSRLIGDLSQLARVTAEVQRATMSMRMVPVGQLFQRIERVIRDLSRKAGKQVVLQTSGTDTEVDKTVAEELSDPLLHMVRNSVDHGIEPVAERLAAGKEASAQIRLAAYHQGGQVIIEIADDGRGLNPEKIRKKAEEKGLIGSSEQLSDSEVYQLIFEPGFSTADKITDVSGRGVGMDVVRRNVEKLRGRIETQSELGSGTTFLLKLPLTLAIIDGLVVEVGVNRYIISLSVVREIFRPLENTLFSVEGRDEMVLVREQLLPVVRLNQRLNIEARAVLPSDGLLVVIESENKRFCLMVDDLVGKQEVVIKSLGETFKDVHGFSGCAVLGDGRVGLILDTDGIYRGRRR